MQKLTYRWLIYMMITICLLVCGERVIYATEGPATDTLIQSNMERMHIPILRAMNDERGAPLDGSGVNVAVIDTGVDSSIGAHIIDRFNFIDGTQDISDDICHGSKVVQIISAVAPGCHIMGYKVFNQREKKAFLGPMIQAIHRAVDKGAHIINFSVGFMYTDDPLFEKAIKYALHRGVVVVSSAGNEGRDFGIAAPGKYRGVISVGATTNEGTEVAAYSGRGPNPDTGEIKPDIVAPGEYAEHCCGTSYAAPYVTGSIALLRQKHPEWTLEELRSALLTTTNILHRNEDIILPSIQGAGQIAVERAIVTNSFFTPSHLQSSDSLPIKLKICNQGMSASTYTLQWIWHTEHEGLWSYCTSPVVTIPSKGESCVSFSLIRDLACMNRCYYYAMILITCGEETWTVPVVVTGPIDE